MKQKEELANSFRCRASAAGKLATNPRSKTEVLSETTKTFAKEWLIEQIYGYRKDIKSKYLDKGNQLEDTGIDKAIEWLDLKFVLKNEKHFEDEFFTGTPDLILEDEVIDIKISYDCFTFPLLENEIPTKDYEHQVQVYMHLTGKKKARVVYLLLNTPENIASWEEPKDYETQPKENRIKAFEFEYQPEVIELLKNRVIETRNFLKLLVK